MTVNTFKTKQHVVGIMGQKRSGKDTFASFLVLDHGFQRIGFADALRDAIYVIDPVIPVHGTGHQRLSTLVKWYGWDGIKDRYPEVRRLLQVTGTEVGRDIFGENIWIELVQHKIDAAAQAGKHVVLTDMRFKNEIAYVKSLGGITLRIDRPGLPDIDTHVSELDWRTINPDLIYQNDTTLEVMAERVNELMLFLDGYKKEIA